MEYLPAEQAPSRDDVDRMRGQVLLEFGTSWCGYCQRSRADVERLLAERPEVRHIRVEDGSRRPLGRSFGVKRWPSFVFLRDGKVVRQLARPGGRELEEGFEVLAGR